MWGHKFLQFLALTANVQIVTARNPRLVLQGFVQKGPWHHALQCSKLMSRAQRYHTNQGWSLVLAVFVLFFIILMPTRTLKFVLSIKEIRTLSSKNVIALKILFCLYSQDSILRYLYSLITYGFIVMSSIFSSREKPIDFAQESLIQCCSDLYSFWFMNRLFRINMSKEELHQLKKQKKNVIFISEILLIDSKAQRSNQSLLLSQKYDFYRMKLFFYHMLNSCLGFFQDFFFKLTQRFTTHLNAWESWVPT